MLALYLGFALPGLAMVVIMEMADPAALWLELAVGAAVTWTVGFVAVRTALVFMEWRGASIKVPTKKWKLAFSALWPVTYWKLRFDPH